MTSGIYIITCIPNKRFYIGSSIDINRRWNQHQMYLRANNHHNRHLQNAWNKYGADAFSFSVLQIAHEDKLEEAEQRYLELLKPFDPKGFNIERVVRGLGKGVIFTDEHKAKIGMAHKGRIVSEETRKRTSLSKTGKKIAPCSDARRNKIRIALTGSTKSAEHADKIAETKRKNYIVVSPDGVSYNIKGMRRFCFEHDLNDAAMIRVAQGKQRSHKGWSCSYV